MSNEVCYWHEEMSEEIARRVLGSHFDYAVAQGVAFCEGRATGAWQCNLQESFGAFKTAARVAAAGRS
ncbi:hypothetical protein G3O06_05350 [Burkholderia sp. Ac-20345]|uniref:hypothetical protein n=1 Tax=Burkholderia sp. Ac-20345 TaxID=2703891 RepID=UPI00197BB2A5|nr:hypothetical protein [Burkholderia sp. Ac-20345]MBN3776995.1 hypothetical protein [Burkholderia sp. Ac-20345]